jgi:hypothetical protein
LRQQGGGAHAGQSCGHGQSSGGHCLKASARCPNQDPDEWAPPGLGFIQNSNNRPKVANSKYTISLAPHFLKFCTTLHWSILNSFLNCDDF